MSLLLLNTKLSADATLITTSNNPITKKMMNDFFLLNIKKDFYFKSVALRISKMFKGNYDYAEP